jgi:hypothetical protein
MTINCITNQQWFVKLRPSFVAKLRYDGNINNNIYATTVCYSCALNTSCTTQRIMSEDSYFHIQTIFF